MSIWYSKSEANIENYYHPFFDINTFYSPDRRTRIFTAPSIVKPITVVDNQNKEMYCSFCLGRIKEATPEKSRTVRESGLVRTYCYPHINTIHNNNVLFRRQGNLFEILSFKFWQEKYGIKATEKELNELHKAFSLPQEQEIIEDLLRIKLMRMQQDSELLNITQKLEAAQAFYSGYHELLTSGYHFLPKATNTSELFSSGSMSWQDHRVSYEILQDIIQDMISRNPFIQFISIFQNWLSSAGASFEHWHKQILALDFWGKPLEREAISTSNDIDLYKRFALGVAQEINLFIAENDHALAYIEVGAKTGYITICSKSQNLRPHEHTKEECHAMSDLVHAMIHCLGNFTPYNEEWLYTPFNSTSFRTPWRIMINIRSTSQAGLENMTQTCVNPISPIELAHAMRIRLEEKIDNLAPGIKIHPYYPNIDTVLTYYQ